MTRFFEDVKPGDRFESETLRVTEAEIVEFAKKYDPQPFHIDKAVGEKSIFKGLAASGWHTAAMSMRLFVKTMNFAEGAVGMGVDELRWPAPVRAGDTLRVEINIEEARKSKSRPEWGIIRIYNVTRNQRNEIVQTFRAAAMVQRRKS